MNTDELDRSAGVELEIDEVISHYPAEAKRVLMVLHALQEHFGYLSQERWNGRRKARVGADYCL